MMINPMIMMTAKTRIPEEKNINKWSRECQKVSVNKNLTHGVGEGKESLFKDLSREIHFTKNFDYPFPPPPKNFQYSYGEED